jgi:uncharacterized caspase-like protein
MHGDMRANGRRYVMTCIAIWTLIAMTGCGPKSDKQVVLRLQDQRTEPMDVRAIDTIPHTSSSPVRVVLAVHDCEGIFSEEYKTSQFPLPSEDRKRWREMGTEYFPKRLADYMRQRKIVLDAIRERYEAADLHLHITLNVFRKDWSHECGSTMETRVDAGKMALNMVVPFAALANKGAVKVKHTTVNKWTLTSEVDADCVLATATGMKICEFKVRHSMSPVMQEKRDEGEDFSGLAKGMPDDVQKVFDDAVRAFLVKVMEEIETKVTEARPHYTHLERPDLDQAQNLSNELLTGKPRNQWAVVIGVSRYQRGGTQFPDLQYADRDANGFCEFLMSPAGGGFKKDHVVLLTNGDATYSAIRNGLFSFLKDADPEDLVVVFFSGHGSPDPARPDNLYLMPFDVDPGNIAATAFPMWDMEKVLWQIVRAQRVIVLADACHSAGVGAGVGVKGIGAEPAQDTVYERYFRRLSHTQPGRVVFSSSGGNERSQEARKWDSHGVFTWALLKALQGEADGVIPGTQKDGIITLQEVIKYVQDEVAKETGNQQHPFLAASPKYDVDLPLGVVSAPAGS